MKQLVLVAVLAAIAASAITALLLPRTPPAGLPVRPADPDLRDALSSLEREVAALRRALEDRAPHVDAGGTPSSVLTAAAGPAAGVPAVPGDLGVSAAVVLPRSARPTLPGPRKDRVAEVVLEWRQPEGRRRWLFATERDVLAELGVPDEIRGGGDEESWGYRDIQWEDPETREQRTHHVTFQFSRGRLLHVYP